MRPPLPRGALAACALALGLLHATPTSAQPPATPTTTSATPTPSSPVAASALATDEAPRVAVVARFEGSFDPAPWAEAIAARLREAAPGRDVRAMRAVTRAECDDACVGARLAEASARLGVLLEVRPEGPTRGPIVPRLSLRLVAPVSGQALGDPIAVTLVDGAPSFEPTALVASFPAPPPPPARLVVAIDVDGATVALDGVELGASPIAPVEVREGAHELTIRAPGHEPFSRRVEVPSAGLRVDVRLVPAADEAARLAATDAGATFDAVETSDPLWKKWWLWAAVGGAVVVGLVVGIAVAASGGGGNGNAFPVPPIPGRM
ncbi:MAG: PEGA domain-containing protein [Myxococcota bacterium]|nr:PEGA domain-containing protein [Myxococcota bacterium]